MYEDLSYEKILKRMLDRVPNNVDKREGSIIHDALAPAAIELQLMYIEADVILNETFADTASREFLIKRAAERGIAPYPATKAALKGIFNVNVGVGERFSLDRLNYRVIEKLKDFEYKLECESLGKIGNSYFGNLVPIDYIEGLTNAELTELLIPGEDVEDTEKFRQRFFDSLDSQAYGGNVADYKIKVNAIAGVGGVKVYPVWEGGGTVKISIISSEFDVPAPELIQEVQEILDPVGNQGKGLGIAPIGHVVTVAGVATETIQIQTNITYMDGWVWEDIKQYVQTVIDDYFTESKKDWEKNDNTIIRVSQIETRLLNVEGIIDIADTLINGVGSNYIVDGEKIPVRGDIIG